MYPAGGNKIEFSIFLNLIFTACFPFPDTDAYTRPPQITPPPAEPKPEAGSTTKQYLLPAWPDHKAQNNIARSLRQ